MYSHFIFSSPIGGANKKGEALQKIRNTLPISVETMPIYKAVATGKINTVMSFTEKGHVQI
jgi:hypothetical protein